MLSIRGGARSLAAVGARAGGNDGPGSRLRIVIPLNGPKAERVPEPARVCRLIAGPSAHAGAPCRGGALAWGCAEADRGCAGSRGCAGWPRGQRTGSRRGCSKGSGAGPARARPTAVPKRTSAGAGRADTSTTASSPSSRQAVSTVCCSSAVRRAAAHAAGAPCRACRAAESAARSAPDAARCRATAIDAIATDTPAQATRTPASASTNTAAKPRSPVALRCPARCRARCRARCPARDLARCRARDLARSPGAGAAGLAAAACPAMRDPPAEPDGVVSCRLTVAPAVARLHAQPRRRS